MCIRDRIWIILFKMQFSFNGLGDSRSINLIPFGDSMIVNGKIDVKEIIENIFIFIPLGIYISILKSEWTFTKRAGTSFLTSLLLEVVQFIFAVGSSDITDLIGNTLGGVIGIGIFYGFSKLFKDKTIKIINVIALIATIFMSLCLGLLLILNI